MKPGRNMRLSLARITVAAASVVVMSGSLTRAADIALSGGEGTVRNAGRDAFSMAVTNASRETKRQFVVGNSFFSENWLIAPASAQARDGLGPIFNARSCSSCHVKDGRGALPPSAEETPTGLLLRLSIPGQAEHGAPKPDPVYGTQLAVRAIPGAEPEGDLVLTWTDVPGTYADGESYTLRRPTFSVKTWRYGPPAADILIGPRLAPAVFGGGLLEAVPEATLTAAEDPEDANKDGISGRLNRVWSPERNGIAAGRFGWKSNVATLRDQTAGAFHGDIGITTPLQPEPTFTGPQAQKLAALPDGGSPEVSALVLDRVTTYLHALGVPARRSTDDPETLRGETLFRTLRCALCHLPELRTGTDSPLPELRNQTIRPYTDLLLHDLGPDLADSRPDFLATGSEWRTAPLWGLGLHAAVNGHTELLHDGRARTPAEAILWHSGEAEPSREMFKQLPKADRAALVAFLMSL